jgi:hypothetical protein
MLGRMNPALLHGLLALVGLFLIVEGLGLALVPKSLGFLAGPGASKRAARGWTRLQGTGFMLLGAAFVMASTRVPGTELAVIALSLVACLMFSLAVLKKSSATAQ